MPEPITGEMNDTAVYWRSFPVGIQIDEPFWLSLSGNAQFYRYPSGGSIYQSTSVQYPGFSFCARLIREAGKPFACKSLLSLNADVEATDAEF